MFDLFFILGSNHENDPLIDGQKKDVVVTVGSNGKANNSSAAIVRGGNANGNRQLAV